uniref:Pentatricopeptide repeat-containing protein, mitochondrial n=1 Tax=Solanum tuberosum TaxID=4113 RepID=M1D5Y5_SOLTU
MLAKIAAAICKHEASGAKTFIGREMHPSHGKTNILQQDLLDTEKSILQQLQRVSAKQVESAI